MFKLSALPLELGNARLRALEPSDAAAFAAGTEDEEVKKFAHLPQPHYTPESVLAMISGDVTEGLSTGTLAVLALADRATDEFAGSLVIFDVSPHNDTTSTRVSAELGFWISARHRGRGLAGDGIELGAQFARACGIDVLRARTVPENEASLRALTGRGFAENGTARSTAPSSEVLELASLERTLVPPPSLPLKTGRLTLRKHRSSDAGWLSDVYGDAAFSRYLLHEPWSLADTQRELRIRMDQTDLDASARAIALVIEHEGTPVGDVSLTYTDPARRVAEIGWAIAPSAAGRGFAAEAARAMLALAFEHYRAHRVVAQMDARNTASAALARRIGMRREAHHLQDWWNKGEWTDTLVYARLSTDG